MTTQPGAPKRDTISALTWERRDSDRWYRDLPLRDLLGYGDILLWYADLLRPPSRSRSGAGAPLWSSVQDLEDLCQRTGMFKQGWTGSSARGAGALVRFRAELYDQG